MRKITELIIHCSATVEGKEYSVDTIRQWHLKRGFNDIGYHFVIHLDGTIEEGRKIETVGAHCTGHNRNSIGICYIGGLDPKTKKGKDTRTEEQKSALKKLIKDLRSRFGNIPVYPHYKFANKACPCFDAEKEYKDL